MVEIEINTDCNRKCCYCPNSKRPPGESSPQYMEKNLYQKIIGELKELGFKGRLSYHFYNEPLLHPNLEDIIMYTSDRLPEARQVLYTNGDLLDDRKYHSLLEWGVHHLVVTQHDSKPFPQRPRQTVLHPDWLTLTNRGGTLLKSPGTLDLPCLVPYKMLIISYDGKVLLCYEDAQKTQVKGDVNDRDITAVWFSDTFEAARKELEKGNRVINDVCRYCDNKAHTQWEDEYFDFTWV